MSLTWQTADDPVVVHRLIKVSDQHAADATGTVVPRRRIESTRQLVGGGHVQIGLLNGQPVVTVTVSPVPSFDPADSGLPRAARPWYMQRLATDPSSPGRLAGFHAVRHAVQVAAASGADALRAEANPDLVAVMSLLTAIGFMRYRTVDSEPGRRTYLQFAL